MRIKTDYTFLYGRAEVELRPLTGKKQDELPADVEFFAIAEGSRVAFVRQEATELNLPDKCFFGRRNSSVSAHWFLVSNVIGYVMKP